MVSRYTQLLLDGASVVETRTYTEGACLREPQLVLSAGGPASHNPRGCRTVKVCVYLLTGWATVGVTLAHSTLT